MDDLLARSGALVDIWMSSLKQVLASPAGQKLLHYGELKRGFDNWKPLRDIKCVATTADDIKRFVERRIERYQGLEPEQLLSAWWASSSLYPMVKASSQAPTKSRPGKNPSSHEEYQGTCRHYARLLTVRSESGVVGNLVARSVNRLVNRGYAEQDIDLQIAGFLEELADWMADLPLPVAESPVESDPLRWLLDGGAFQNHGFWPVPTLSHLPARNFRRTPQSPAGSQTSGRDLLPSLIALVTEIVEGEDRARVRELWQKLFEDYLTCSGADRSGLVARTAGRLEAARRKAKSSDFAAAWKSLLGATAKFSEPGRELIPPVNDDGSLDWDAVGDRDVQVVSGTAYDLEFGFLGGKPATVRRGDYDPNLERVQKWHRLRTLANSEIDSQIRGARTQFRKGETVRSPKEWLPVRLREANGAGWFDELVESSRRDADKRRCLHELLRELSLKTYPSLNDRGEPVWSDELPPSAVTRLAAGLLQPEGASSEGPSGLDIVSVEQFSWTPQACRITVREPFDPRFQKLRAVLNRSDSQVPVSVVKPLEDLYTHVVAGANEVAIEKTLKQFLGQCQQSTEDNSLDPVVGNQLLIAVRSVLSQLKPSWSILPGQVSNDRRWSPEGEADVDYRFDAVVPPRQLIRVETFGLRRGEQTLWPPRVVVSMGPQPAQYREVLDALPLIEEQLGPEVAELLRTLPRQIANKTYETLCHELFVRLWPVVEKTKAVQLNRDTKIDLVRDWFEKQIVTMEPTTTAKKLRVTRVRSGDSLIAKDWKPNKDYQEAGKTTGGESVDVVVRPQLSFVTDGGPWNSVREPAVLYVKD